MKLIKVILLTLISIKFYCQDVNDLIQNGIKAYDSANYLKSNSFFDKAILKDPKNSEAYLNRALSNFALNRYTSCLSDLAKAKIDEQSPHLKYRLLKLRGECYYHLENWEKAIFNLDKYLGLYPEDVYITFLKAESLYNLKQYKEAVAELEFVKKVRKLSTNEYRNINVLLSYSYLALDNYFLAQKNALEIYNKDTLDKDPINILFQAYYYDSKYDSSDYFVNRMLQIESSNFGANYVAAMNCYYRSDYLTAINKLNKYLILGGKNLDAYYYRSICKRNLNDYKGALADSKTYINKAPKDAYGFNNAAWLLFLMKRYSEALIYSNKSLFIKPDYANSLDTRACINYKMGNIQKAIIDFDKALSLDSALTGSYYFRGLCYLKIDNKEKACENWKKAALDKEYKILEDEKAIDALIIENCKN